MDCTRIEKYVNAIGRIAPGGRNEALHNIAILLRTRFGLEGRELESVLAKVNEAKCTSPLDDIEVSQICRSVDKANAPVGESRWVPGASREITRHRPCRVEYNIHLATPFSVATILEKQISVYSKCWINTPNGVTSIRAAFEEFRTGT